MLASLVLSALFLQSPNDALVPVPRPDDWWTKRHAAAVEIAAKGNIDMVFIGDSITHGFGGMPQPWPNDHGAGADTWAWYYGARNVLNLGFSGDQTQHVLWRIANGEMDHISPKVIQIMIGTNNMGSNTAEQIAEGVEAVCTAAHFKAPKAKELLLAIFPRDMADSGTRAKVAETNKILEPWAKSHGVSYLDIGHVFLDTKGEIPKDIMPDKLHPNAFGYRKWAMATEPTIARMLRQKPISTDDPDITTLVPVTQNRDERNDWMPRHAQILGELQQDPDVKVVLIGDSITQFFGSDKFGHSGDNGQAVWDQYLAPYNPINEGFGWDRIENVLWRIQQGELNGIHPKAIVLMIGTNNLEVNPPGEIKTGIQAVLRDIRARQPKAHIVLLGLFPRGQMQTDPLREKAHEVNMLLANMDLPRNVKYVEIWSPFLQQDGSISSDVMSDYLHPTAKGYEIEMGVVEPILKEWVK
ncbi:MAG TPA: GDSL-type esterase/lipase family protein [Fimbriimonadaceae bacterium]|jgi:lysophospholipase L1-like esterase